MNDTTIKKPGLILLLSESRVIMEALAGIFTLPFIGPSPRANHRIILVIPGFATDDRATFVLRHYLNRRGYRTAGWKLGINWGSDPNLRDKLATRIKQLSAQSNSKITLIGWSLGGIYARELARHHTEHINAVITLGSPFSGTPTANNVFHFYQRKSGGELTQEFYNAFEKRKEPPPVPTVAIHSRSDGVVAWRCSLEKKTGHTKNIAVFSSHLGLVSNPLVLSTIGRVLQELSKEH